MWLLLLLSLVSVGWATVSEAADFPIRRSACASTTASGTSHPICNPPDSKAGDRVIAFFGLDGGTSTQTWPSSTYCTGSAWTQVQATTADATPAHSTEAFTCVLTAPMSGTENVTSSATEVGAFVVIVFMSGSYTGTFAAQTPVTATSGTALDPPSLTSGFGAVDTLWLVMGAADTQAIRPVAASFDTNYTSNFFVGNPPAQGVGLGVALKTSTAATEDPGTAVLQVASTDENSTNTFALQGQAIPASGGSCVIGASVAPDMTPAASFDGGLQCLASSR